MHGWACDSHDWSWLIPHLRDRGFRVLAVDHRGHGHSSVPEAGYTPQQMASDAANLLRSVGTGPALIVGHSMGTIVASALAIEHPDLVKALILIDPVYNRPDDSLDPVISLVKAGDPRQSVAHIFRSNFYTAGVPAWIPTWHERRVLGTAEHVVRESFLGLFGSTSALGRTSVAGEYLRSRTCPTLAVYAAEESTWIERQLPAGSLDRIAVIDGGHWLHQERPDEFHSIVDDWLETLTGAGAGAGL
ncbi:alpha/beta fold hydrolase [Rhodococcus tibetensis]|uniref:Alpha/beta hydrolase n=1 Tax=Rhodococcus tibetensis TaxID=2965064 RepID=A0ABT1QII6_9NOCA|nr:alpha/beta hydrolase [Rhodococcus sp. FXJ9.536]MCQ4122099.1 alpha/beta hydrolase [Rhodococcus sp. FXJ9.536]